MHVKYCNVMCVRTYSTEYIQQESLFTLSTLSKEDSNFETKLIFN